MSVLDWASGATARVSAAALAVTGFVPGTPAGAKVVNDLVGRITDWIRLQQSGVYGYIPGSLVWTAGAAATVSSGALTTITIARTGAGVASGTCRTQAPIWAAASSPVYRIGLGAIDADTVITVLTGAPGSSSLSRYQVIATTADAASTVTAVYAPTTAPLDGPDSFGLGGAVILEAAIAGSAPDLVVIASIELDFS